MKNNNIHIAFGFHVNCYHSYRGDTNDEKGFGSDIRIIRKIIACLDKLNSEGIPVKGTWDIENFFSLEQILPAYAPDIIDGIKRRVQHSGDENIIMGYSNGALGAMTENELKASIELSVTNPEGTGLRDIFGQCSMIVRPQEVMFSPPQVKTYNELGVKALCLYYSCVPFDAFKTLIPPLSDELAFNPLKFEYKNESITVIPTYSNADVCDAGCLRAWVKELHKKQENGEINTDLFLFINMDADAVFWESLELPLIGSSLANTDGINGLVREVADLSYVVFDTPEGYLDAHPAVDKISFEHDTADGNFTGYASWSEKPFNRKIWTSIERSRLAEKVYYSEDAFLNRVKLLSTTHFGLATPVLNISREQKANELSVSLKKDYIKTDGEMRIYNTSNTAVQCFQLKCREKIADVSEIKIESEGLESFSVIPMDSQRFSLFFMLRFNEIKKSYSIKITVDNKIKAPERSLKYKLVSKEAELCFSVLNSVCSFTFNGETIGDENFLSPFLTYGGKKYAFEFKKALPLEIAGGEGVRLEGCINLPGAQKHGGFAFDFFTCDVLEGIFVKTDVCYPLTPEADAISTENSTLGRFTDNKWEEACPFYIKPRLFGEISVIKRNFAGDMASYNVSSFGKAVPENRSLASFNNHLTSGAVGLTNGKNGIMLFSARSVLSSMAHCPMRLFSDGSVAMSPFGTLYGPQRVHPNRSGGRIPKTYTLIAPQGKSLAPSYNGNAERFVLCLLPFSGSITEKENLNELLAFSDGAFVSGTCGAFSPFDEENVFVRSAANSPEKIKMRSPLFTGIKGNLGKYIYRGVRAVSYIVKKQRSAKK